MSPIGMEGSIRHTLIRRVERGIETETDRCSVRGRDDLDYVPLFEFVIFANPPTCPGVQGVKVSVTDV